MDVQEQKMGSGLNWQVIHKRFNNVLSIIVVCLGLYLIVSPLIPSWQFWWNKKQGFNQPEYVTAAINNNATTIPDDNRFSYSKYWFRCGN